MGVVPSVLLLAPSELLFARSCLAAFHCSGLRALSTAAHPARQPSRCGSILDLPFGGPRGGSSPLASPSKSLIGADCFLRTGYLPVLTDLVSAPTALFQVNLLALEGSHSGVGNFLRALLLGSLFRCWVGTRPSS